MIGRSFQHNVPASLSFAPSHYQVVLPRFDAVTALELIGRHGVTAFIAVPTMIRDLLSAAASLDQAAAKRGLVPGGGGSSQQWSSVRRILVGAGGTDESMQASKQPCFKPSRSA